MKLALAALLLLSSVPAAQAAPYESQGGYAREQKCFKKVYKETYVPGTMKSPGYVKTSKSVCASHVSPYPMSVTTMRMIGMIATCVLCPSIHALSIMNPLM